MGFEPTFSAGERPQTYALDRAATGTGRTHGHSQKLRKMTVGFVLFARLSAWNSSAPTERMFMKFYIWIFWKFVDKIEVSLKSDKNDGHCTWRSMYIFDHVSLNSSKNEKCLRQKLYRKSKHTFRVQSLFIFFENRAVYETMWKNTVEPNRPHVTIGRMRIAYWVSKSANTHTHTHTHTHSEYVILIAFPLQQWL